jgi:predicted RNase H-like HicB family nuclease
MGQDLHHIDQVVEVDDPRDQPKVVPADVENRELADRISRRVDAPNVIEVLPFRLVRDLVPLPGCVAAGDSVEEVEQLIREAIPLHVESLRAHGESVPPPQTRARTISIELAG